MYEELTNPIRLPLKLKYRVHRSFKCGKYQGGKAGKKTHNIWWHLSQSFIKRGGRSSEVQLG